MVWQRKEWAALLERVLLSGMGRLGVAIINRHKLEASTAWLRSGPSKVVLRIFCLRATLPICMLARMTLRLQLHACLRVDDMFMF